MPRVIVTAPLVRATRRTVVDAAGASADAPARILRETTELDDRLVDAASAAKSAGADVIVCALCEAGVEKALRARLEAAGASCAIRVVPAASAGKVVYENADGSIRFAVQESRQPSAAEQDRLLDDIADELMRNPAFVVIVGDLDGAKRPDFGERVVGRSWGLGHKSFLATDVAALKQAYHTYAYGLIARREDIASICAMPRSPAGETEAQTIERSFSELMCLFAVRTGTASVELVAHDLRVECATSASDARIAGTIGALAAADPGHPAEVVRKAADRLRGVKVPAKPEPVLEREGPR